MTQLEEFGGQALVSRAFANATGPEQLQRALELRRHHANLEACLPRRLFAVHFTINAIKIAKLVRIQVHAHGQSARAWRNDGVNEAIVEEVSRVTKGGIGARPRRTVGCSPLETRACWHGHGDAFVNSRINSQGTHARFAAPPTPDRVRA